MNNLEKINRAIRFIENNLKEDIHLYTIAFEACCSKFHFHRIFQIATGETVFNYIRKRRLSEAAEELQGTKLKIWEIANNYQFVSPEAFSRAFCKAYGKTPSDYRKKGIRQIYFGRVKLSEKRLKHYQLKLNLKPEIKTVEDITLSGRKLAVNKFNVNDIVKTWQEIISQREYKPEIFEIHLYVSEPDNFINHDENSTFHRIVAAKTEMLKSVPNDFIPVNIPKGKYAVFTHQGTRYDSYLSVDYIWATWMMKNEVETDNRPAFEYYGNKYLGPDNPKSIIEYYLPIN
jgi:AraC family transcriptional regulator